MPIVQGNIGPIEAQKIRLSNMVEMNIPIPVDESIHIPQLESSEPLVVAQETLEHARKCAQRLMDNMQNLPHSEQAGDLLAMALTVLHFVKE